jgi:SAM-dependent methyltransferase
MGTHSSIQTTPTASTDVALVCPACRGELDGSDEALRCGACARGFRVVAGIADLRTFPDPYLSVEEDLARTDAVLAAFDRHDLRSLLEYYWSLSDVTPEVLRARFVRSAMLAESRAETAVRMLSAAVPGPSGEASVLEIGSGTGGFLAAAASRFGRVTGVDIAMRWLHVSRRRFADRGLEPPALVCSCAEQLPFPDATFDAVAMTATLEFTRDPAATLAECARVLTAGGALYVNTVNRYSLARDPYAYVWGVGMLPRRWQAAYVRWRRDASYENIRLLSFGELDRLAARHFPVRDYALPDVADEALAQFPPATRAQVRVYRRLKASPVLGSVLRRTGPGWDALFRMDDGSHAGGARREQSL